MERERERVRCYNKIIKSKGKKIFQLQNFLIFS